MAVQGVVMIVPERRTQRLVRGCLSKFKYSKKTALKVASKARSRAGEITVQAYACPFHPDDHYHVGHCW